MPTDLLLVLRLLCLVHLLVHFLHFLLLLLSSSTEGHPAAFSTKTLPVGSCYTIVVIPFGATAPLLLYANMIYSV